MMGGAEMAPPIFFVLLEMIHIKSRLDLKKIVTFLILKYRNNCGIEKNSIDR
jgi:hypothetical protein